jgi:hypothetical protein
LSAPLKKVTDSLVNVFDGRGRNDLEIIVIVDEGASRLLGNYMIQAEDDCAFPSDACYLELK